MKSTVLLVLGGVAAVLAASPATASHIFSTDVNIHGTPVASGNAFTDPTIAAVVGTPVTFEFDLFGDADTFNVSFGDSGGSTVATPAPFSTFYDGTGTQANPVVVTFTRTFLTAGVFDGFLVPDLISSFPDYLFPGGSQGSEPAIPFTINVAAAPVASTVPEPTSMVLGLTGGVGLVVARLRRRKAVIAA